MAITFSVRKPDQRPLHYREALQYPRDINFVFDAARVRWLSFGSLVQRYPVTRDYAASPEIAHDIRSCCEKIGSQLIVGEAVGC